MMTLRTTTAHTHREHELALQESEERFRSAFDFAAIGMALVSTDGRWLQLNRAICEILGYSEAELLALTFQDITHPEDLVADLQYAGQLLRGDIQTFQMEKRYFHKDGHIVWALLSASLVRSADNLPVHFIAQIQDISASKHAEKDVRESEERFQLVVQATHDGIWDWNMATGYCYYSPRYKELLGCTDIEVIWDSFEVRLHPEDRESTLLALRAHLTERQPYDVEYRLQAKAGEYKWFHARGQASWDAAGKPMRFTGALHDITDRKQSELALEHSQKFLDAVIEGIPQPMFVKDSQHRWVLFNNLFCKLMGHERAVLLDHSDPDISAPDVVKRYWAEDDEALRATTPLFIESSVTRPDGSTSWLLKSKQRVDLPDGAYIVGLATDITRSKETEIELRASEERFRGLTQLSTDWFWEQDEHFRFVSQSGDGGLTRMHISRMGKTRWELDFVGVSEAAWAEHKAILEAHLPFHDLEMGRRNDDGDTHYISISGEPVFDEAGKFKGYRGVGRDITARKQVEQALQASEESHRLLAENSSDMILRITP
ncbi:MAG: PAS domain S-box protein, partial [Betaproteobacteria bacterium]